MRGGRVLDREFARESAVEKAHGVNTRITLLNSKKLYGSSVFFADANG